MPSTIGTTKEIIRDAVTSRCYVSDKLGKTWKEVKYLYCDELRLASAPTVESATLSYDYGPIRREDEDTFILEERQELLGKYVKIVLEKAALEDADVTWYGVIEVDDVTPFGSGPDEDKPRGRQRFTAYGLLRLLERVFILSSRVDWSQNSDIPVNPLILERGLRFNKHDKKLEARKGNRSAKREDDDANSPYVFSESLTSDDLWTTQQAAEYILRWNYPVDADYNEVCSWQVANTTVLDWDNPVIETDRRTVKQVLDMLISRKRGFSYRIVFDEDIGARGTATVVPFSFADVDIVMEDFRNLPANENQYKLNFEKALDVEVRIVDAITDSYDSVIAIGEFATSTFTLAWGYQANSYGAQYQIAPDWSDSQYTDYLDGASGTAGYAALGPLQKQQACTRYRESPSVRPVFRRWKVYPWWNKRVWNYEQDQGAATKYYVNPFWGDSSFGGDNRDTDPNAEPQLTGIDPAKRAPDVWPQGMQFEQHLPLMDRCDYSTDKISTGAWSDTLTDGVEPLFREPLFYVRTDQTAPYKYELLEQLSKQSSNELQRRRWSAQPKILTDRPGFEVNVCGGPQHFLASHVAAAIVDQEAFLDSTKEAGLSWLAIRSTVCARLPWRVQQRVDVEREKVEGRQSRTLYLDVEARLDYVVPDTVVSIDNGSPVLSTSGGFVRDDRQRLADIANAAAQWYTSERQTLFFRIHGVLQVVPIGGLITEVGGKYQIDGINTVVTGMRFDLLNQTTEWETSFAEIEFT